MISFTICIQWTSCRIWHACRDPLRGASLAYFGVYVMCFGLGLFFLLLLMLSMTLSPFSVVAIMCPCLPTMNATAPWLESYVAHGGRLLWNISSFWTKMSSLSLDKGWADTIKAPRTKWNWMEKMPTEPSVQILKAEGTPWSLKYVILEQKEEAL